MIAHLTKSLAYPQYFILQHILKLWLFSLVTIISSAWLLRGYRVSVATAETAGRPELRGSSRKTFHKFDYASVALLVIGVCFFVFLLYYKADFDCFDCAQLMDFPLSGRPYPPLWATEGRFFPLGFQEFNLLRHVTRTPAGFQSVATMQLIVLVAVLFVVLKECRIFWRALISIAVVTTPSFVISFTGMINPERNALFFLVILILCLQSADRSRSPIYFLGCFAATHFLLYYKEPLVVLVVVYAASRIALNYQCKSNATEGSWKQQLQKNIVPIGMIVIAAIYCMIFLVFMFPYPFVPSFYIEHFGGKKATLLTYLSTDLVLTLFIIVCLVRAVRFVFGKQSWEPLWDSLALGAFGYFFAILATGIYAEYYLAPTDFIAFLYLGRLAGLRVSIQHWRTVSVGLAYVCLVVSSVATSTLLVLDAKENVIRRTDLASFLEEYHTDAHEKTVELYFPKTDGLLMAELSSYLHYKGLRLAGLNGPADSDKSEFVFAGPDEYPLGRCLPYKIYLCKHIDTVEKGGLTVFLPSNLVGKSDVEQVTKNSTILVSVKSWPENSLIGRGLRLLSKLSPLERETYRRSEPWWQFYIFRKRN